MHHLNDFLLAKVRGYPYWPAIILKPDPLAPPKPNQAAKWVYFFGSRNYSWVPLRYIKPLESYDELNIPKYHKTKIDEAYRELERHRTKVKKFPSYEINVVPFKVRKRAARSVSKSNRRKSRSVSRSCSERSVGSRKRGRSRKQDDELHDTGLEDSVILSPQPGIVSHITVGVLASNIYAEVITRVGRKIDIASSKRQSLNDMYQTVLNLLINDHRVVVWSPSRDVSMELKEFARDTYNHRNLMIASSIKEVVQMASIIFSCFSNYQDVKANWDEMGLVDYPDDTMKNKVYVEMTSVDYHTSFETEARLIERRGFYVEAMIQGSRQELEDGDIRVLVGVREHSRHIVNHFSSCFWAIGKNTVVIGKVGMATKTHAVLQLIKAACLAGFAEALAMSEGIMSPALFMDIFKTTDLFSPYFKRICYNIKHNRYFDIQEPLSGLQQDLEQILRISDAHPQALPMAATANQLFKLARRLGFDDLDSSGMVLLGDRPIINNELSNNVEKANHYLG